MRREEILEILNEVHAFIQGTSDELPDLTELYYSCPEFKHAYDNDPVICEFHEKWDKWIARKDIDQ